MSLARLRALHRAHRLLQPGDAAAAAAACGAPSTSGEGWSPRDQAAATAHRALHTARAPLAAAATSVAAPAAAGGDAAGAHVQASLLRRPWHEVDDPSQLADTVITPVASAELGPEQVGLYYPFDAARVPEAFQAFHQAFYPPRPPHLQRRGGCRPLQAEFAASGRRALMWRAPLAALAARLERPAAPAASAGGGGVPGAGAPPGPRVLVVGEAGAGKSVGLAALIERHRSRGGVALYIPDAAALVGGGFFAKRPRGGDDDEEGGGGGGGGGGHGSGQGGGGSPGDTYDTLISAQHVIKSVVDSHQGALQRLPAPGGVGGGGGSLLDVAARGLSTDDDARLAVDACLALVHGLAAAASAGAERVLFAVDNYEALFGESGYGASAVRHAPGRGGHLNQGGAYVARRRLHTDELTLASHLRLLHRRDLGAAAVVAALGTGGARAAAGGAAVLRGCGAAFVMPRFSSVEAAHLLHYYHECGAAEAPSAAQADKLRALTSGSGAELRRLAPRGAQMDLDCL